MSVAEQPVLPPYSAGDALGYGWRKFSDHPGRIIGYGVLLVLPGLALYGVFFWVFFSGMHLTTDVDTGMSVYKNTISATGWAVLSAAEVALFFYGLIARVGVVRATTRVLNGEPFSFGDLVGLSRVGVALATVLLVTLGTLVGLVLCVLPGIAFAFLASYALWFVVDKGQSPFTAIKSSIAIVRANLGQAIVFWLLAIAVGFAGELACGVGVLVAIPVTMIATGYTYRRFAGDGVAA